MSCLVGSCQKILYFTLVLTLFDLDYDVLLQVIQFFVHREKKNGKHTLWILGESYEFNEKKKMMNH